MKINGKQHRSIWLNDDGFSVDIIDQTVLPMREVAFASGFSSVKRFNTAIREAFGRTPSELRKLTRRKPSPNGGSVTLRLPYRQATRLR